MLLLLDGMQSGTTTWENSLTVSYIAKHIVTIWSSNPTSGHLPKRHKNLFSHKIHMYAKVYSSFLQNHPKLETTQMSFNRWVDKQTVAYPHNGKPPWKKNKTIDTYNISKHKKSLSEKTQTQKDTSFMISFYDNLEKAKLQRGWTGEWVPEDGRRVLLVCWGVMKLFCMLIWVMYGRQNNDHRRCPQMLHSKCDFLRTEFQGELRLLTSWTENKINSRLSGEKV
jgi:hypothetical protein